MKKNNDTKDYLEQLEFLNSEPYYASKKIVNQSSDFPVRRTDSYRHKKALIATKISVTVGIRRKGRATFNCILLIQNCSISVKSLRIMHITR